MLSMTQSSLEMLGKQTLFFMCCDVFLAQKICAEGILKIPCLALVFYLLWFSQDQNPLVLNLRIVNWLLNPSTLFEPTSSTPNTFQVQILSEIYDKTRVCIRIIRC